MNHVHNVATGERLWAHVGSLPSGLERDHATEIVRSRNRAARMRDGLVPDVPRRDYGRLLCGCPSSAMVVDEAGVEVCGTCSGMTGGGE